MSFWVDQLSAGQNYKNPILPNVGDLFHRLHANSMGSSISKEDVIRVTAVFKSPSSQLMFKGINLKTGVEETENIHIIDRLKGYKGHWFRTI